MDKISRQFRLLPVLVIFVCSASPIIPAASGQASTTRPLPDFSYTQGWLGADDAYSVAISPTDSVWLFGDTFVGTPETKLRSQAKNMPRNSVGISHCESARPCSMKYYWRNPQDAKPRSFFDTEEEARWYWPLDGFYDGKTLYIGLLEVRNKPNAGPTDVFGFEISGTRLAIVENPLASPDQWKFVIHDLTGARLWAGVSIVPDGKYVIWYTQLSEGEGKGYMVAMRVPRDGMRSPSEHWEYLNNKNEWAEGAARDDAMHVIEQGISEMSVRYHPSIRKWIAVSAGPEFPSGRMVARTADFSIGPWSAPQTIYQFPEMQKEQPGYDKDTFCYAVKEHTEFTDTKLALTYACNSMVIAKVMANMNIYRPRVVILDLPR